MDPNLQELLRVEILRRIGAEAQIFQLQKENLALQQRNLVLCHMVELLSFTNVLEIC